MSRSLLAVHAHPDDESLTHGRHAGAGAVAAGADVTLVTATLGEQGEVIGDELQGLVADRADQLGGYRLTELRAACAALGITDQRMLGGIGDLPRLRDGRHAVRRAPAGLRPGRGRRPRPRSGGRRAGRGDRRDPSPPCCSPTTPTVATGTPITLRRIRLRWHAAARARWRIPRVLAVIRPSTATRAAFAALHRPADYLTGGRRRCRVPRRRRPGRRGGADRPGRAGAAAGTEPRTRTQVELLPGGFALSNRIAQPLPDTEYFRLLVGDAAAPAGRTASPAGDVFAGLA